MAGCWTCRIRKKRCDHAKPSCGECSRLNIPCDGYSKKPAWADGGAQEAKYRKELKDHIRRKAKNRRSNSLPQLSELTPPLTEFGDTDADTMNIFDNQFDDFFSISPVLLSQYDATVFASAGSESIERSVSSEGSEPLSPMHTLVGDDLVMPDIIGYGIDESSFDYQSSHHDMAGSSKDLDVSQCEALMRYLDHLFWSQFPICDKDSAAADRTWVLMYLFHSPLFKKALVQLSATSVELAKFKNSLVQHQSKIPSDLPVVVSFANDLSLQSTSDIEMSLAATSIFAYQALIKASGNGLTEVLQTVQVLVKALSQRYSCDQIPSSTQPLALKLCLSQGIFFDTLHAAIQRQLYVIDDLDMSKLEEAINFNTEEAYGCPMWTLQAIRSVIKLDLWKREHSAQGRLSIPELVSRSSRLLELLKSKSIPRRSSVSVGCNTSTENPANGWWATQSASEFPDSRPSKDVITQLYINAASMYLHIIVSGANPHLSEVKALVESSIGLVQSLRTLDVFACVVWPLMITSCLASGEQRENCRFVIMRAMEQDHLRNTFSQMFEVAQECWRLANDSPLLQWDWKMAMDNLGLSNTAFILAC